MVLPFRFLYIDLFIIIPIAIASKLGIHRTCENQANHVLYSGKDFALSPNRAEKTDVQSGIQKGVDQYHWSDTHQLLNPNLCFLLG
jgi:hypothetical protein